MKHVLAVLLALLLLTPACLAEDGLGYRFADAEEASDGEGLPTPEIIQAIDAYLKTGVGIGEAA